MRNSDQEAFWSGTSGLPWVTQQDAMDCMLEPVLDLLMQGADLQPDDHVLDVGCGTGASLLRASDIIGPSGRLVGVDISSTLLDMAKTRLQNRENTHVFKADAQEMPLGGPYSAMISRFGVMFFEDTSRAFANIAKALKPGARMVMTAWAAAPDNPYFMLPAAAARDVFGPLPKTDRTLPGPFAFEDPNRVLRDFSDAGLHDVQIETHPISLTPPGSLADAAELCLHIGSASSAITKMNGTPQDRTALKNKIMERFEPFVSNDKVLIPASIHLISARVP